MKKVSLVLALSLLVSAQSQAAVDGIDSEKGVVISSIGSTMVTLAPTVTTQGTSNATSNSLKNDMIQVQGDAVIALDTGVISSELKSVVDKIRSEYQEDTMNASDIEVVEMVFGDI